MARPATLEARPVFSHSRRAVSKSLQGATRGQPRNREVPINKRSRTGTSSVPFPQRDRIKRKFISGENISQIAREEARHWATVKRIVEEKDVQEYVKDLRARFYGTLEGMLFAAVRYARDGKDGGC
jgi:hypothetical protein